MIDLDLAALVSLLGVTFVLGMAIGFVGAGGAGLVVALLTSAYHVPVHTAIGTALATMCVVTLSGASSHLREGNVAPRLGLAVGLSGAVGAVFGAGLSQGIPDHVLRVLAGLALWALAALVWLRSRIKVAGAVEDGMAADRSRPPADWARSIGLGTSGGAAAAFFGIGMAPFLQLGFLALLRLPLRLTVGTTMFALVFISASGALALARHG
ncbi:MAG TPA: sulfite exporter TauE/SafE family protein, partial [Thermomicrobiales bacterium]|nr:sulfite exporter TauE/SafE family protein [Thermomicrobiales bacterium]